MQWILVVFGWAFSIICALAIIVPYLRRRADLLSTWNLFLLGSINFVGIATIDSGHMTSGLYGNYSDSDYVKFVVGAIAFYVTAFLTYRFVPWPARWAERRMKKWTRQSILSSLWLVAICGLMVVGYFLVPNVQLLGQLLVSFGINASIMMACFAFGAWYQRPFNPPLFAVLLFSIGVALIVTISSGYGRRNLLSALMAIPVCLYWLRLRYQPARKLLIPMGVGLAATVVVIGGYSMIRHRGADRDLSIAAAAIQRLKAIPGAFMEGGSGPGMLGADTTEASLLAIGHYERTGATQPFHTIIYILQNPIPRAWYPNKVGSLGEELPRDTGWWARHGYVSWGAGIVGHGYYEGGVHFLILYGFLIALGLRFWDELLVRQPSNLVLLGIYAAASAQVFALVRGEVPLFIVLIFGAWATGFIVSWVGRMLFGTQVYEPDPEHPAELGMPLTPENEFDEFAEVEHPPSGGFANY